MRAFDLAVSRIRRPLSHSVRLLFKRDPGHPADTSRYRLAPQRVAMTDQDRSLPLVFDSSVRWSSYSRGPHLVTVLGGLPAGRPSGQRCARRILAGFSRPPVYRLGALRSRSLSARKSTKTGGRPRNLTAMEFHPLERIPSSEGITQ